jgi:hypothetical protein
MKTFCYWKKCLIYLKKINLYVECIIEELSPELVLQELLSADNANYIVLISFESKAKQRVCFQ